MLRFQAVSYINITATLGHIETVFRFDAPDKAISDEHRDKLRDTLKEMVPHLDKIGLKQSCKKVGRMVEATADKALSGERVYQAIDELRERIRDEMEDGYFLHLSNAEALLVEPKEPLLGKAVQDKLPALVEDVSEAGKCMGLGRYTASVFHLMRVMEHGVQSFGKLLGVHLAAELNWQNILDLANKAIKGLDQKDPKTKRYAEISSNLYNVKLAWRNEVMHPKATYTPDEAEAVLLATRNFMRELVSELP